jgi:hypothetical protein
VSTQLSLKKEQILYTRKLLTIHHTFYIIPKETLMSHQLVPNLDLLMVNGTNQKMRRRDSRTWLKLPQFGILRMVSGKTQMDQRPLGLVQHGLTQMDIETKITRMKNQVKEL